MSILKFKNADGTWNGIAAFKGENGKDGAIQYKAGAGIKIENDTITAEVTKQYVDTALAELTNMGFTPEVVESLPTENIKTNIIYMLPAQTSEAENIYEEWMYINNKWEMIGSTSVDLTNYYTKDEANAKLDTKQNKLTPGENITIDENNVISANGGNDSIPTLYIYTNMNNSDIGFKYYGSTGEPTITLNEFLKNKIPFFNIMLVYNRNSTYSGTNILIHPNWKPTDNIYDGTRGDLRFYSDVYYTPKGDNGNIGQGILVDVDTDLQKDDNGNVYVTFFRISVSTLNYLSKNNTTEFTPIADYHPATKKYVDDSKVTKSGVLEY